jgi:hypothetical protein
VTHTHEYQRHLVAEYLTKWANFFAAYPAEQPESVLAHRLAVGALRTLASQYGAALVGDDALARLSALISLTTGAALRDALAKYEATGDHDHGRGPLPPGAPCNGFRSDECWVQRARATLAAIDALNHPPT